MKHIRNLLKKNSFFFFCFLSPILYFILLGRVAPCATVWGSNKLQGPAMGALSLSPALLSTMEMWLWP